MMTNHGRLLLTVRTEPVVDDPREMKTIVTSSLQSLFGDLEPHSCQLTVMNSNDKKGLLLITCPETSVSAVRAALTLVAPPPYLESTVYRFDVVNIRSVSIEK
jgi:RNase P/RNase MRP subunit POP5